MAKLKLVKPELTEEQRKNLISDISDGTLPDSALEKKYGLTRQRIRTLKKKLRPPIRLPSRKGLNLIPVTPPAVKPPEPDPTKPTSRWARIMQIFGGLIAVVIACAFGSVGGFFNYQFCSSLGRGPLMPYVLGSVGVLIDAGSTFLPTFASTLAEKKLRWPAFWAAVFWFPCILMTITMEVGFASSSIGDSLQARGDVTKLRAGIEEQLEQIKEDRKKIDDPLVLEKKIAAARDAVGYSRLASSQDCTPSQVTTSFVVCDPLIQLRKAKETAEAHIANANKKQELLTAQKLALPPVSSKSPLADIVQKISGVTPEQTEFWQSIMFAMLCAFSPGLFMWFARGLLR